MKKMNFLLKIFGIIIICVIIGSTTTIQAVIVFEDTFENAEGWVIADYVNIGGRVYPNPDSGNGYIIAEGMLKSHNLTNSALTVASRNCSTAYGSWSFDWWAPSEVGSNAEISAHEIFCFAYTPPTANANMTDYSQSAYLYETTGYQLMLMASNASGSKTGWYGYAPGIVFQICPDQGENVFLAGIKFPNDIEGSHHIEITRDSVGHFIVNFDNEEILDLTDNTHKTSKTVGFVSYCSDSGFDNITVKDDKTATTTIEGETTTSPASTNDYTIWIIIPLLSSIVIMRKKRNK